MLQLTQQLGSGAMAVQEVPAPECGRGSVAVRNHFSLISAGTEASTVRAARASLVAKVRERPEQARQALDLLRRQGLVATWRAISKKLEAYSPLGYSCAGEVVETGGGVAGLAAGDLVACAGVGYANHAEIVVVPVNLCVKLPPGADLRLAAYNAVGAVALQGVRQADVRLGECCGVVGLGLVGQLTCMLLRASGVRAFGIDVDPSRVEFAAAHSADFAWTRDEPEVPGRLLHLTGGLGLDAVIITAAGSSTDPVDFAGRIARRKGRVVIVGAVPAGFRRDEYYRKELDLRMSCSYGPGRYDPAYEEDGVDYPAAYVRWTEHRNMSAFQDLVHTGRLPVGSLTTHEFALEEAERAYDLILGRTERYFGVLLRYDVSRPLERRPLHVNVSAAPGGLGIGFIGAGSYAQGNLLPHLPSRDPSILRRAVVTRSGTTCKRVAEKFGFEYCTSDAGEVLRDRAVDAVFIATRHDSHARYVCEALSAGKHVFVEKPLAITADEQALIERAYGERAVRGEARLLMVGFNRRFSSFARAAKEALGAGPMAMVCRINAGAVPAAHWIHNPSAGGGRIIGEACHFIDLMTFFAAAAPVRVYACAVADQSHPADTAVISLEFADGSIGTIAYYSNGSSALEKEYIELHAAGTSVVIRDFRKIQIAAGGRVSSRSAWTQDKGQAGMIAAFLDALKRGGAPPISFDDICAVSRASLAAVESLRTRAPVTIGLSYGARN